MSAETSDVAVGIESALDEKREPRTLSPRQTKWVEGRLLHIHIAPTASAAMEEVAEATLVVGRGIEAIDISWAPELIRVHGSPMPVRSLFLRWKFWTRYCGTILLFSQDQSRLARPIIAAILPCWASH